jgi:hypothetical protein
MSAAAEMIPQERLLAGRDLRVAVGEDAEIVEVKTGQPWPAAALGRVDLLIRTGHIIRFTEAGELDPRSWRYAKRLGMERPPSYPARMFHERARALAQITQISGRRVRVFAGKPDGAVADLCVVSGRAYGLRRGAPDTPAASGALRSSPGGVGSAPRRRASSKKATTRKKSPQKKRRRKLPTKKR